MYEPADPTEVFTVVGVLHTGATDGEPLDSPRPLASVLASIVPLPCFMSFLNLERLFWNQIFTWKEREKGNNGMELKIESKIFQAPFTHGDNTGMMVMIIMIMLIILKMSLEPSGRVLQGAFAGVLRGLACVWVSPRDAASSALSGSARYWVCWNLLFRAWSCKLE